MRAIDFTKKLKERLIIEFKRQDRSGIYGYMQRSMAYNSNKIEGSTLTEKQTASIFETGTLYSDNPDDIFRTKDIEEMTGHFKMFNYMLQHMDEMISDDMIKTMHRNLKEGVFEDIANGYAIGDYKKRANRVSDIITTLPNEVPNQIKQLVQEYQAKETVTIADIAEFHARFENIHPFQDGNGRVGRMIIVQQCLQHNLVPVIIKDIHKVEYMRHLNLAQKQQQFGGLIDFFKKEQMDFMNETLSLIFDYEQLEEMNIDNSDLDSQ